MDQYFDKEISYGAMLGPFEFSPFSVFTTSPLQTVSKKDSEARRVVVDLSFPPDHSVNSGIPKDTYEGQPSHLHYKGVDDLATRIVQLGSGCLLYKLDLHRAYRQLRLCPADYFLTGIYWKDSFYLDISIPFGLRTGALACQRTTDAVAYIFKTRGYQVYNYLDDFAGAEDQNTAQSAFQALLDLLNSLGLAESPEKRVTPCTVMDFLGITFNSVDMSMEIPVGKRQDIFNLLLQWRGRTSAPKQELQSLLGKLHFAFQCVRSGRLFVSRMLDSLRQAKHSTVIQLDSDFQKDVNWWIAILGSSPRVYALDYLHMSSPEVEVTLQVYQHRCTGLFCSDYYQAIFPSFIVDAELTETQREMLNLVLATKLWANTWSGRRVLVSISSASCVKVLAMGRSKDTFVLNCAREVASLAALCDFRLLPQLNTEIDLVAVFLGKPLFEHIIDPSQFKICTWEC